MRKIRSNCPPPFVQTKLTHCIERGIDQNIVNRLVESTETTDSSNSLVKDDLLAVTPNEPDLAFQGMMQVGLIQSRELRENDNLVPKFYVYKNGLLFAKNATIAYDDFYKTYIITFTNEKGRSVKKIIKRNNFITKDYNPWNYNYQGNVYLLSDLIFFD